MKIKEVMAAYELFCPQSASLSGDPVGLQLGDENAPVKKVLVALDIREQTVDEAIELGVDLIIVKHPLIFSPLSNLTAQNPEEALVLRLAAHGIAVYVSHTNIDRIEGGLNDYFCQMLGLKEVSVIGVEGLLRIGETAPLSLSSLMEEVKKAFGNQHLRLVTYEHELDQIVNKVAICGGSGGKFWPEAKEAGADVYITADIYYHVGHEILSSNLTAIDPGHYMEHAFVDLVAEKLGLLNGLQILKSQVNTNPFFDV